MDHQHIGDQGHQFKENEEGKRSPAMKIPMQLPSVTIKTG
jgi:hypothetical protein